MPLTSTAPNPTEDGFVRKRWTVRECRALVESGLLPRGKFELLDGEIIFKAGQGRAHIFVVTRLMAVLGAIFGANGLQSQAPVGIGAEDEYSDPEPDVAVLRGTVGDYLDADPDPANDVLLAVEAANTTVRGDLTTKATNYAAHAVREYWVVSIPDRELVVHRQPTATGYGDVRTYTDADSVAPLAAPSHPVAVADLLP